MWNPRTVEKHAPGVADSCPRLHCSILCKHLSLTALKVPGLQGSWELSGSAVFACEGREGEVVTRNECGSHGSHLLVGSPPLPLRWFSGPSPASAFSPACMGSCLGAGRAL